MIADLQSALLTILFNPVLLVLFLLIFFLGKFIGKLAVRPNIWKILALLYVGLLLFQPLRDSGPLIGGVFLLGVLSSHTALIFNILGWARNLGDVIFALRHRRAFDDIRRREQELDERERAFRAEEARFRREQGKESQEQHGWRDEAKRRRKTKTNEKSSGSAGGRSSGSGSSQNRSSERGQQSARQQSSPKDERDGYLIILGLRPGRSYTREDYKRAYRRKAKNTHPDGGGSQSAFIAVGEAYGWLQKFG